MSMGKKPVNEEMLERVAGGFMVFERDRRVLTYERKDGSTKEYKILDLKKAWELANSLHGQMTEDQIVQKMMEMKYIE
ncbi:MAG: hypothetical protein IKN04_16190 [Clostridia bacterium]|nr:hypothetical protein [Clostridia bacterium]